MFKVGDHVKGTERGDEHYTGAGQFMVKAEVTEVYDDGDIEIMVLEHEFGSEHEGEVLDVTGSHFDLVSSTPRGTSTSSRKEAATVPAPSTSYEMLVAIGEL